jgi:C4-dicarboxylate transporter DctQ subunit
LLSGMSLRWRAGPGLFNALDRSVHRVALAADQLSAFICAVLIIVTTGAMIVYQAGIAIAWLDDVLRMLLIWLVYMGAVRLCLDNDHISMDALYFRLPKKARKAVDVMTAVLGVGLCLFTAKIGFDSMTREFADNLLLPSGEVPAWPQTMAIPLAFGLMAVAYLSYLISTLTGRRQPPIAEAERHAEGI